MLCGFCQAYCLYSIWEHVVDLHGVGLRESWQVSVEDDPGHLALWLVAFPYSVRTLSLFISCTDSRPVLVQLSRSKVEDNYGKLDRQRELVCVKDLVLPVLEGPFRSDSGYSAFFRCYGWSPSWETRDTHTERETDQHHWIIAENFHNN